MYCTKIFKNINYYKNNFSQYFFIYYYKIKNIYFQNNHETLDDYNLIPEIFRNEEMIK